MKHKAHQHPFRDTFLTRHHLLPKIRLMRHTHAPENKLMLWRDRHNSWHYLFKNYTLKEIIIHWDCFKIHFGDPDWVMLFHNLSFYESKRLLQRVYRIKRNLKKYR